MEKGYKSVEKIIKLVMAENRSIHIYVNDKEEHTIEETERKISALKLYEILDCKPSDHYSVILENEKNVDSKVLEFFTGLLEEIINKVNDIEESEASI